MIGWFGDRADNMSPDGAELCLQTALKEKKERKKEQWLLQFSPGAFLFVLVNSQSSLTGSSFLVQFVVQDRLSVVLTPEYVPGCC